MPDTGFARHDLCSIALLTSRTSCQSRSNSGFSADGYPPADDDLPAPLASGIDRAIRLSTVAAVLAVAGIAAYVSLGTPRGRPGPRRDRDRRRLRPRSTASSSATSMVMLYAARRRVPVPLPGPLADVGRAELRVRRGPRLCRPHR